MYLHNVTKQPLASNTRTNSFDTVQSVYTALYDWSKNYVKEICPLEWSTVTMKPKFEANVASTIIDQTRNCSKDALSFFVAIVQEHKT